MAEPFPSGSTIRGWLDEDEEGDEETERHQGKPETRDVPSSHRSRDSEEMVVALSFIVQQIQKCRQDLGRTLSGAQQNMREPLFDKNEFKISNKGRGSSNDFNRLTSQSLSLLSESARREAELRYQRDQLESQLREATTKLEKMKVEQQVLIRDFDAAVENLRRISRDCCALSLQVDTTCREHSELKKVRTRDEQRETPCADNLAATSRSLRSPNKRSSATQCL